MKEIENRIKHWKNTDEYHYGIAFKDAVNVVESLQAENERLREDYKGDKIYLKTAIQTISQLKAKVKEYEKYLDKQTEKIRLTKNKEQ